MPDKTFEGSSKYPLTPEARSLAEIARAIGLGDSADDALSPEGAAALRQALGETPLLADVLRWQGTVSLSRGETRHAEILYEKSLETSLRIGHTSGRAHALNGYGSVALRRGDIRAATRYWQDSLGLAEQCDDRRLQAMVRQNLGVIADMKGDVETALQRYIESLVVYEAIGDRHAMAWALNNIGFVHAREGRYALAEEAYERGLSIAVERGDLLIEGGIEENRAELALQRGNLVRAEKSIERALAIAEQRSDPLRRATALKLRGMYWHRIGRSPAALDDFRLALTLSAIGEDAFGRADTLHEYGIALADHGDKNLAREVWSASLAGFERIGARKWADRVRDRLTSVLPTPTF